MNLPAEPEYKLNLLCDQRPLKSFHVDFITQFQYVKGENR